MITTAGASGYLERAAQFRDVQLACGSTFEYRSNRCRRRLTMSLEILGELNWLAVIVGALV